LLSGLNREFGWKSRLASLFGGRYVLRQIRREEKRLAAGWTCEPPTFYETTVQAVAPAKRARPETLPCPDAIPHAMPVLTSGTTVT